MKKYTGHLVPCSLNYYAFQKHSNSSVCVYSKWFPRADLHAVYGTLICCRNSKLRKQSWANYYNYVCINTHNTVAWNESDFDILTSARHISIYTMSGGLRAAPFAIVPRLLICRHVKSKQPAFGSVY